VQRAWDATRDVDVGLALCHASLAADDTDSAWAVVQHHNAGQLGAVWPSDAAKLAVMLALRGAQGTRAATPPGPGGACARRSPGPASGRGSRKRPRASAVADAAVTERPRTAAGGADAVQRQCVRLLQVRVLQAHFDEPSSSYSNVQCCSLTTHPPAFLLSFYLSASCAVLVWC
jgi:hypothetical protein